MKHSLCAGGVVLNKNDEVLVVSSHHDSWSLPKGHIDQGETALEAARREIHEETGVSELVLHKELGTYERYRIGKGGVGEDTRELKNITLFLFRTSQLTLAPLESHHTARWVKKSDVSGLLTHPKDAEFFEKIRGTI